MRPAAAAVALVRARVAAFSTAAVSPLAAVAAATTAAPPAAAAAAAVAPVVATASSLTSIPPKFKGPFKRASQVMSSIDRDARARMAVKLADFRAPLAPFTVGDAVEITYAHEHSDVSPVPVRGVVIAQRRKGIDSNFTIINAWDDEWYTATYPLASPLLRSVRVMMRNRHTEGEKRARRAKLTYLFGRDPKTYMVDQNTREAADIQAEKQLRRELQKAGKVYKKVRVGAVAAAARAAKAAAAGGGKPAAGGGGGGEKKAAAGGGKGGGGGKK